MTMRMTLPHKATSSPTEPFSPLHDSSMTTSRALLRLTRASTSLTSPPLWINSRPTTGTSSSTNSVTRSCSKSRAMAFLEPTGTKDATPAVWRSWWMSTLRDLVQASAQIVDLPTLCEIIACPISLYTADSTKRHTTTSRRQ